MLALACAVLCRARFAFSSSAFPFPSMKLFFLAYFLHLHLHSALFLVSMTSNSFMIPDFGFYTHSTCMDSPFYPHYFKWFHMAFVLYVHW